MKTLLLMLALCGTMLAAAPKPDPAAAAKERRDRMVLANDFRRVADKLSADEIKAVRSIVAKHKGPTAVKPAAPAAKPAPAKKK
jgi:hypothetical protein